MVNESTKSQKIVLPLRSSLWRTPLIVGICCGLGYAATNRLLALRLPAFLRLGQSFDVRPFPGHSLESLRRQFGNEGLPILAEPDFFEPDQQTSVPQEDLTEEQDPVGPVGAATREPLAPAKPTEIVEVDSGISVSKPIVPSPPSPLPKQRPAEVLPQSTPQPPPETDNLP